MEKSRCQVFPLLVGGALKFLSPATGLDLCQVEYEHLPAIYQDCFLFNRVVKDALKINFDINCNGA
jgi:hypothetical protein